MAGDNPEIQGTNTTASSKAGTIKLIIMGIVVIILAAGISFAVAMYAAKSFSAGGAPKGEGYGKAKSETLGTTYDIGEFVTNLSAEGGNRFIKVKIVLAFQDSKVQEELINKLPQVQHTINSTLRQQTPESLSEPKAMEKLADLLRKNINSLLIKGNINSVYFTTFQVQ